VARSGSETAGIPNKTTQRSTIEHPTRSTLRNLPSRLQSGLSCEREHGNLLAGLDIEALGKAASNRLRSRAALEQLTEGSQIISVSPSNCRRGQRSRALERVDASRDDRRHSSRTPASQTGPRYLSGGFIDWRTSMRACWLTVRLPSCGRSRSAISAMTAEKVTATTMMASDRIVPTSPA
jgi:hypothetical protein